MIRRLQYVLMTALVLALAGVSVTVEAQRPYRNDRAVRQILNRLDNRTNQFRNSMDAALDRSRLDGTRREDNINQFIQDFDNAVEQLRQRFNNRSETSADVQEVLNIASRIDRFMQRNRLNTNAQNDWAALRSDVNQLASAYNINWNWSTQPTYGGGVGAGVGQGGYGQGSRNQLTGTFRLDTSRSDDPRDAAERATRNISYRDRQRVLNALTARLEAPTEIAIDRRGRNVTIASTRAPQISFDADGQYRTETMPSGRQIRTRAMFTGDQLMVSTTGDRGNDFEVTFDPVDGGQRMRVTRRVTVEGLNQPVQVQSLYERTSDVAQLNIYNGSGATYGNYPGTTTANGTFVVPDNMQLVAVLNSDLNTQASQEGDRFTMTVRSPAQFDGAVIEGYVSNLNRSGRVSGRSEMTLNFDSIRLRNGSTYRFAGVVESVRTLNGENVRVDNEGSVRDSNQTSRTVQRTAIGSAVGAIIGAIAGGGKGAAIGAAIGAGAGAGSVYVQGRDDLELRNGTELTIRASSPR
ncbi:MAG TPA: YMGG-like glycine zipper-containing protein [Pyrinomonadaceae bacterium]|nr:YMGG-like glycine zipper-containing protein [Pyrinomonadaceae bacterium]